MDSLMPIVYRIFRILLQGQPTFEKPAPSNVAADESRAVAVVARKQSKRRPSVSEDGAATGLVPLADEYVGLVHRPGQEHCGEAGPGRRSLARPVVWVS
jgi:hypothetical protein